MIKLGVLCSDEFVHEDALAQLRQDFDVYDFREARDYDVARLAEACRSVEVLLTGWSSPKIPAALADDPGRLKYVCHARGSVRHVLDKSLLEAGVIATNWGDEIEEIAEGAMALLLCMLKQIPALDAFTKGGRDERIHQMFTPRLKGLDVGLYGFGPIGRHTARMLEPFGARIAVYDPYATEVPADYRRCATLRDLFSTCQAVSIHCGLNAETEDSVTRELLELLPPGGILINTARGKIVDEEALAHLVRQGRIVAGLDVIRDEKNWPGSPLAGLRGAVLSKHAIHSGKGYPPDKKPTETLPAYVVRNLEAWRQGQPLVHEVSAAVYDLKT